MTELLKGKVAIVTGGTSGIGLATVERFVNEGAQVVIADIQDKQGAALSARLGKATLYVHTNVMNEGEIEALVAATVKQFGRLDVMHNNAGVTGDASPMTQIATAGFDACIGVIARSVLMGHKYAAKQFIAQGTTGAIVTTSSVAGLQGGWSSVGYTTGKHAVTGIIHQAAVELAPFGIRSNGVAPGAILTPMLTEHFQVPHERTAEYYGVLNERLGMKQSMGRFGMPDDVAKVAAFLASDLSAFVTGVIIPVDAGASSITQSPFFAEIEAVTREFLAAH